MKQAYVYGIDDLYNKWELLLSEVKKQKISEGRDFYEDNYYTALAIVLLSWYGCSIEEILSINKDDVSENGIKGFENISFDRRDLNFFIMYANTNFMHRNKNFGVEKAVYMQSTFIRTTEDIPITSQTISDMFSKVRFPIPKESEWLRKLFTSNQVLLAGIYDKIYQYGKEVGVNFADTNRNKNITQDMILHISEIFNCADMSHRAIIERLKRYSSKYYCPRIEWEKSCKNINVDSENTELNTETIEINSEIIKNEQNSENDSLNNQDILVQKLTAKVEMIQKELTEIQEILAFLNNN